MKRLLSRKRVVRYARRRTYNRVLMRFWSRWHSRPGSTGRAFATLDPHADFTLLAHVHAAVRRA